MKLFIQEISTYIYKNIKIDSKIVDYCENKLYEFRNTPIIDKSIKGLELHKLEHNILGYSIDFIKTNLEHHLKTSCEDIKTEEKLKPKKVIIYVPEYYAKRAYDVGRNSFDDDSEFRQFLKSPQWWKEISDFDCRDV